MLFPEYKAVESCGKVIELWQDFVLSFVAEMTTMMKRLECVFHTKCL